MITQSKIFEVFEDKKLRRLYTKNLVPGSTVYAERLVVKDTVEYREWDPARSKLAATILKGSLNISLRKDDVVLYLGAASGTTVSHVSDIVGTKGFVFAIDFAPRVVRDLYFLCMKRNNIAPILADANNPESYLARVCQVDVLYQDIAQKNQLEIFFKNVDLFLKPGGYALLALKARSIDVTKKPKDIFSEVKARLSKSLTVIDYRELAPFQLDHCFFICKK
ncbi:MAG: fibrillarin-like rRNA/tRNA 2'-O-methyltransferase [Candidatus Woesearchaeota archaeon]